MLLRRFFINMRQETQRGHIMKGPGAVCRSRFVIFFLDPNIGAPPPPLPHKFARQVLSFSVALYEREVN